MLFLDSSSTAYLYKPSAPSLLCHSVDGPFATPPHRHLSTPISCLNEDCTSRPTDASPPGALPGPGGFPFNNALTQSTSFSPGHLLLHFSSPSPHHGQFITGKNHSIFEIKKKLDIAFWVPHSVTVIPPTPLTANSQPFWRFLVFWPQYLLLSMGLLLSSLSSL